MHPCIHVCACVCVCHCVCACVCVWASIVLLGVCKWLWVGVQYFSLGVGGRGGGSVVVLGVRYIVLILFVFVQECGCLAACMSTKKSTFNVSTFAEWMKWQWQTLLETVVCETLYITYFPFTSFMGETNLTGELTFKNNNNWMVKSDLTRTMWLHWGIIVWRHCSNYSTSSINTQNFVLAAFGIVSGVKRPKLAVCLIFWFRLHARWFDWCQIGSLNGDSFGGTPCCGNCGVWVRGLVQ